MLRGTGKTIGDLDLPQVLNVAYATLVDEAATVGRTRHDLDMILASGWDTPAVSTVDEQRAVDDFMGGIRMQDLLDDEDRMPSPEEGD